MVVAGAETAGLVRLVGGVLGCGAGVCAEAMEAITDIATGAIRAEIMRVFMRMILPAGSTASNEKAHREVGGQRPEIRGQSNRVARGFSVQTGAFCACQEMVNGR